ncbi:MAG: type II toxin-antitoxin system VapC family toxin [Pirellulales bacterium]
MLILDTDYPTEFQKGGPVAQRLNDRLKNSGEPYSTTIISVEEVMRGWMAAIRRSNDPTRQINSYRQLRLLFRFFSTWQVLDWTAATVSKFQELKSARIRIGTMDLKIASIALMNDATLLTRNRKDYENVAGLSLLDWLSE